MKKHDILILHDGANPLPNESDFDTYASTPEWGTEIAVYQALRSGGHQVRSVAFTDELSSLLHDLWERRPDVVFNLAEASLGEYGYDKNLPAVLELLRLPYTGCNPVGLALCNDKAISKSVLAYHGIPVPRFCVYRAHENATTAPPFPPPYFVKPLNEEASAGICQRSRAEDTPRCLERVRFIHSHLAKDALVEEYIDGRELYVGVLGGGKEIRVLPVWELKFTRVPETGQKIATYRVKWDPAYRAKWGIRTESADTLPAGAAAQITDLCTRAYRALNLDGPVRFDLRMKPDGSAYIIEANANPELAPDAEFAQSAAHAGIAYETLIETILRHALARNA